MATLVGKVFEFVPPPAGAGGIISAPDGSGAQLAYIRLREVWTNDGGVTTFDIIPATATFTFSSGNANTTTAVWKNANDPTKDSTAAWENPCWIRSFNVGDCNVTGGGTIAPTTIAMNVTATGPVYTEEFLDFVLYDAGNGELALDPQYLATVLYTAADIDGSFYSQMVARGIDCSPPAPAVPNHGGPPTVL